MSNPPTSIRAIIFDCDGVLDIHGLNRDLVPILERLNKVYRLAILTSADRRWLDRFLNDHHIGQYFDTVLTTPETAYSKPDRELFEILAKRLGVENSELLFIDDAPSNTRAAQSYGIPAITFRNTVQLQSELRSRLPN